MNIIVGVSDAKVSSNPDDVLATYSLGSCIGVAVQDPIARVAGLLHFQLPNATADASRAAERPCMYADSGMAFLLAEIARAGGVQRRLRVRLAGGAQMLNDSDFFDIGRRNHAAIRKILWKLGMLIESEHVGGASPRTLFMKVSDGNLTIKSNGQEIAA
ncbi:MAG TPA: chemotaxis protein CheD [Phycisphaerae bacterium]|nr:chemotaxis protein CheD [Phycisphaerae bacterium]